MTKEERIARDEYIYNLYQSQSFYDWLLDGRVKINRKIFDRYGIRSGTIMGILRKINKQEELLKAFEGK
jgi:hypothetical protein